MKVLENGDYKLDDGTIIPRDQVTQQYKNAQEKKSPEGKKDDLQEGQCSGKILLQD
jgi:hypothetical protein